MTRTAWIVTSALGALLVAAVIVGLVIVGQLNTQADQRAFEDCMARKGHAVNEQAPPLSGDGEVAAYIDDLAAAAAACRG